MVGIEHIILGSLTLLSASGVVICRKPLNSALWLVLTLFLIAGHYAALGAHFLAALQVLVYAGAIMVVVVFLLMLLGTEESDHRAGGYFQYISFFVAAIFSGIFGILMSKLGESNGIESAFPSGTTELVGISLFTKHLSLAEFSSILLLAALVGAVLVAKEAKRHLAKDRGLSAMHNGLSESGLSELVNQKSVSTIQSEQSGGVA